MASFIIDQFLEGIFCSPEISYMLHKSFDSIKKYMYRIMLAYIIWWSSFRIKDHQRNLLYFSFKKKSVKPIKILLALETSVRKYETLQFWSSQTDIFGIYWSALKSKPGQIISDYHPLFYILCVLHLKFRFYFYFMDS